MPPYMRQSSGEGGLGTDSAPVPFKMYVDTDEYDVEQNYTFAPFFPPDDFVSRKKRNVKTEDNLCEGETVEDNGAKNRVINVSGVLSGAWELLAFEEICDLDVPVEINTMGAAWEGEVRIEEGTYRGPVGTDTRALRQGDNHWRYTLNLISTGRDEYDHYTKDGILEEADSA